MLRAFQRRAESQRKAGELYGAIVTQARRPEFYADLGVPDTPTGRYEMVVLHLVLVLERLKDGDAGEFARDVVEAFVADMDDSLRELGTGDLAVPRKVRRAAAGLYERLEGYRAALREDGQKGLQAALVKHGLYAAAESPGCASLAAYVRRAAEMLARQDAGQITAAKPTFPLLPGGEGPS
jgi:cytochrome b pre-mRNA-processing protein 3